MELLIVNGKQAMDSRDIAKLTGKNHADVCRDVRSMIDGLEIGESNFASSYKTKQNKEVTCYKLPFRETMILLSGYSVELRAKVVDRWLYLEKRYKTIRKDSADTRKGLCAIWHDRGATAIYHYSNLTKETYKQLFGNPSLKKAEMNERQVLALKAIESLETFKLYQNEETTGYHALKNSIVETVSNPAIVANSVLLAIQ